MDLAALASCRDLGAEHAEEAARSVDGLRRVLARAAEIAEAEDGGPKILLVLSRLARGDVGWLEGDVTIDVHGDDAATTLDVFAEQGWGIKERLAPQARFAVPFDEFQRAVAISSKRLAPLRATVKGDHIVLTNASSTSDAPPAVELDENSVATAPPPALVAREPEPFDAPAPSGAPADPFEDLLGHAVVPVAGAEAASEKKKPDPVHSRPTVRRMVAIKPEALRTGRKDPRREDDD